MRRSAMGRWPVLVGSIAAEPGPSVFTAIVYRAGLRSFPEADDFVLLADARILRNPLALFVHEHFSATRLLVAPAPAGYPAPPPTP